MLPFVSGQRPGVLLVSPYIKCVGFNACSRDWQHVTWWVIPVFLRLLMGVLVVLVLFYFVHCVTRTKQKTIENFVCRKRKYGTEFKYQFFRLYFLFQIACNCVQIIKSSVQCIFVSKVEEFPGQSPGLPLVPIKFGTRSSESRTLSQLRLCLGYRWKGLGPRMNT